MQKKTPILPKLISQHLDIPYMRNITEDGPNCIDNVYTVHYYAYTYKDNYATNALYCVSDTAIDEFYKNGGTFSEYELNNIKFQRLFDDDFVLNKNLSSKQLNEKFYY